MKLIIEPAFAIAEGKEASVIAWLGISAEQIDCFYLHETDPNCIIVEVKAGVELDYNQHLPFVVVEEIEDSDKGKASN